MVFMQRLMRQWVALLAVPLAGSAVVGVALTAPAPAHGACLRTTATSTEVHGVDPSIPSAAFDARSATEEGCENPSAAHGPTLARSADDGTVVLRARTRIRVVHALAGIAVFAPRRTTVGRWRRVVEGRVLRLGGAPEAAVVTLDAIGKDRRGRVVMTVQTAAGWRNGRLTGARWWLYDIAADRTEPLSAVARGACAPMHVSVWRSWVAYAGTADEDGCPRRTDGVRLSGPDGTRLVSRLEPAEYPLALRLRRDTLVTFAGKDARNSATLRLVYADGSRCSREFTPSMSDQTEDSNFRVRGAWLRGGDLVWWMDSALGTQSSMGSDLLLAARVRGGCSVGRTGGFPRLERSKVIDPGPIAVDGETLYYAEGKTLLRRPLAAMASLEPPPNDRPAAAERLVGTLPITKAVTVGYATRTSDEPQIRGYGPTGLATAKAASRTNWYRYTATESGRLHVWATQWTWLQGGLPTGAFALFRGSSLSPVTRLPHPYRNDIDYDVVDVVTGEEVLIGVGCDTPGPCFPAFELTVSLYPPGCDASYCPPDGEPSTEVIAAERRASRR
jgi:hypothetical protein